MTRFWEKESRRNIVFALVYVLILGIFTAAFFDFYFDLNDDVLMKDIMSGAYSGTPSGYSIQMLYPISAAISLFYKVLPEVSWYAVFLCGSQFLCFYLIAKRSLDITHTILGKVSVLLLQMSLSWGLLLQEMVFIQYTVTGALLAGTAVFLFYTTPRKLVGANEEFSKKEEIRLFWRQNLINVLLIILSFQIRTEMLLLVLPFAFVAGICKWSREKDRISGKSTVFCRYNFVKYLGIIGAAGIGLLISLGASKSAYGSTEWKTFNRFFDARTSVYDFYGIPSYEENRQFYESIGMKESQYQLLENYNFGLDDTIDVDTLEAIEEYSKGLYEKEHSFLLQIKTALRKYAVKLVSTEDAPWNICVVASYILVIVFAWIHTDKKYLWQLPFLFFVRSGLWLYILYRERTPNRITHSLYLVEMLLLLAFLFTESKRAYHKRIAGIAGIVLCVCTVVFLPSTIKKVQENQKERTEVNEDYMVLRNYCMKNQQNYYLLDVYSTVAFSEKMFGSIDNSLKNYDIMGGWASKSPLQVETLAHFGMKNIEKDLLSEKGLYFVSEKDHMDGWMERYYANKGITVNILMIHEIQDTVNKELAVYQLVQVK